MRAQADPNHLRWGTVLRIAGWAGAAGVLLLPLVAMQVTEQIQWTAFDFLAAAALIGALRTGIELAVRASASLAYRAGAALALGTATVLIWGDLAVGIVGDRPHAAILAIPAVALLGGALTGYRARGLAWSLAATAVVQIVVTIGIALESDRAAPLAGALFFTALWLAAAALFARSAARSTI